MSAGQERGRRRTTSMATSLQQEKAPPALPEQKFELDIGIAQNLGDSTKASARLESAYFSTTRIEGALPRLQGVGLMAKNSRSPQLDPGPFWTDEPMSDFGQKRPVTPINKSVPFSVS